jgi:hypothetical protein
MIFEVFSGSMIWSFSGSISSIQIGIFCSMPRVELFEENFLLKDVPSSHTYGSLGERDLATFESEVMLLLKARQDYT